MKKIIVNTVPVVFGIILAGLLLSLFIRKKETKFEELALGKYTSSCYAMFNGQRLHGGFLNQLPEIQSGVDKRGLSKRVLWLGNSQLHGINQFKKGQNNSVYYLFRYIFPINWDLIAFSIPNGNLAEFYILFEYIRNKIPVNILVLPVVFDDMRNDSIRSDLITAVPHKLIKTNFTKTKTGGIPATENEKILVPGSPDDMAGLKDTIQEKVEKILNKWMAKNFLLWNLRKQARGSFFTFLYRLRNSVFNISAQTKRPMIKGRYELNLTSLKSILESAKNNGIKVLVYNVPIRHDVEIPYIITQYEKFKKDIEKVVKENEGVFVNLENVVPTAFWGRKGSTGIKGGGELDFMHFKEKGHIIVARNIYKILIEKFFNKREK